MEYNAKTRKAIIKIAKDLGCKDVDYLDKNSNVDDNHVINSIYHHHCANDTLRRIFKERTQQYVN